MDAIENYQGLRCLVKKIDAETRRIEAVASREMIDRDGEIVSIGALRAAIKGYMANPVVLAGHQHKLSDGKSPVIGKVVEYRFSGKDLWVTVEFADTSLALEYWGLYRDKFQRAFSIGFRGLKSDYKNIDGRQVRVFTEVELYELSCVAVGSNPGALSKAKAFVLQKRREAEKQKILNDMSLYEKLLDRFERVSCEHGDPFGNLPGDSAAWEQFSAAEIEILKDLTKYSDEWGFDPDWLAKNGLWDENDTLSDDEGENYAKLITGDSGAFWDDSDSDFDFDNESEGDYF